MSFFSNLDGAEIYERGALLLTVLAVPDALEVKRGLEIYRSLCARALWLDHLQNQDDAHQITVQSRYIFRDRSVVDRDVSFVEKRFRERMVAARMAVPFLQRGANLEVRLPKGVKRLSLNEMANFVLEDAGQAVVQNLLRRVWRPSRKVIHLAVGASYMGQLSLRAGQPIGMDLLLSDNDYLSAVLSCGEEFAKLIESDPTFPAKGKDLIRLALN